MAAASSRVGRTSPSSLYAAGVESCSSTPTCPSRGVAVLSLVELVRRGEESIHLSSRGQRPAGTRTFSDPECGLLIGCRVVPEYLPASSHASQVLSYRQGWGGSQARQSGTALVSAPRIARQEGKQPSPITTAPRTRDALSQWCPILGVPA